MNKDNEEIFTDIISLIAEKARAYPQYPVETLAKEALNLFNLYYDKE